MSSQKTEHYELNQWLATDQVLRTDFNADNAKIDAALAALVSGKADTTDLDALSATVAGHTTQLAQKGNCRIEILTYTGNGNSGSSAPNYLNFSAMPAAFLIAGYRAICVGRGGAETGTVTVQAGSGSSTGVNTINLSWSGNTLAYYTGNEYSQLNVSGQTYWALALIPMDQG